MGQKDTAESISIHAPVKGATQEKRKARKMTTISIHAPVKGATGDPHVSDRPFDISIHAPVKGATEIPADHVHGKGFQSTLP